MGKELLFKTHDIGKVYGNNTVLQGINIAVSYTHLDVYKRQDMYNG